MRRIIVTPDVDDAVFVAPDQIVELVDHVVRRVVAGDPPANIALVKQLDSAPENVEPFVDVSLDDIRIADRIAAEGGQEPRQFSLGLREARLLDKLGRYDDAFDALERANSLPDSPPRSADTAAIISCPSRVGNAPYGAITAKREPMGPGTCPAAR